MSISAKVICDSISPQGIRFTSFEITCHRWILAEINTHRALSRNYRSSRAVPVTKLIQEVRDNPAMPVAWLKNKPGMVATEPMTAFESYRAEQSWRAAAHSAAHFTESLGGALGLHKQWANRVLEPFLFVHGVISGTDWNNFFSLRQAPDAQPEFKALADLMHKAMGKSPPDLLVPGQWHLPYVSNEEREDFGEHNIESLRKHSVARVARVSIKPFDGEHIDVAKDLELYDRLLAQCHMSPFEHQATPDSQWIDGNPYYVNEHLHGNLTGWVQYRKTIPNECVPG
jgi:thymidylate synthase ThyX